MAADLGVAFFNVLGASCLGECRIKRKGGENAGVRDMGNGSMFVCMCHIQVCKVASHHKEGVGGAKGGRGIQLLEPAVGKVRETTVSL